MCSLLPFMYPRMPGPWFRPPRFPQHRECYGKKRESLPLIGARSIHVQGKDVLLEIAVSFDGPFQGLRHCGAWPEDPTREAVGSLEPRDRVCPTRTLLVLQARLHQVDHCHQGVSYSASRLGDSYACLLPRVHVTLQLICGPQQDPLAPFRVVAVKVEKGQL